ncbi:hypothetical protein, partial [Pseudomonas fragi]|uniref:hypothetical protein n=1 Tax=Pseudomonas fragi TaxID=296 RepID=UPI001CB6ED3C
EYEVSSLAFEFSGKDTTLLGHLTPRYGEHSRLNECPVSLDHYTWQPSPYPTPDKTSNFQFI